MVATHAEANHVPEALVHRVIVRESRYQPELVGRGGTIGLMQIKLATARGLGYTGDAEGLRDPDTNLTYGVKYLAGAYRAADGDHDRAVHYYAAGYYYAAKRQRLELAGSKRPEPRRQAAAAAGSGDGTAQDARERRVVARARRSIGAASSVPPVQWPHRRVDTPPLSAYIRPVPRGAPMRS